jgi:hypothetical protein
MGTLSRPEITADNVQVTHPPTTQCLDWRLSRKMGRYLHYPQMPFSPQAIESHSVHPPRMSSVRDSALK